MKTCVDVLVDEIEKLDREFPGVYLALRFAIEDAQSNHISEHCHTYLNGVKLGHQISQSEFAEVYTSKENDFPMNMWEEALMFYHEAYEIDNPKQPF